MNSSLRTQSFWTICQLFSTETPTYKMEVRTYMRSAVRKSAESLRALRNRLLKIPIIPRSILRKVYSAIPHKNVSNLCQVPYVDTAQLMLLNKCHWLGAFGTRYMCGQACKPPIYFHWRMQMSDIRSTTCSVILAFLHKEKGSMHPKARVE